MNVDLSDARRALERCEVLGRCSDEPDRLTRPFGSPAMRQAQKHVREWMREAGLQVRTDNIGNLRGRREGPAGTSTLLLGSHLDSVRGAGKYDGPLGIVVALEAVDRVVAISPTPPFCLEVVCFADEEGLRFGSTYLGSRALAGTFDPHDLDRVDSGGKTLAKAITEFGGDPARIANDRWEGDGLLGYCEVHIEQGPQLESRNLPVGVVTAIAGQSRYELTFTGSAGHAGTVPMDGRADALAAAAQFVLNVEAEARKVDGLVATVGSLKVEPGAANVIPGRVVLSLDVRHAQDAVRISALGRLLTRAALIADSRQIVLAAEPRGNNPAVPCSLRLVELLVRACEELDHSAPILTSGAGHDGVALRNLTDIGMLFVRCKGGVSHNPAESVTVEDVAVAIDVLTRFVELFARRS